MIELIDKDGKIVNTDEAMAVKEVPERKVKGQKNNSFKKDKKDKKSKKDKKHKVKVIDHDMKIEDVKPVDFKGTRYAARSKFIRSKRSAISDPSALKEIFMMS